MSHQSEQQKKFEQVINSKKISNYSLNSDMSFNQQKHKFSQKQQNQNFLPSFNELSLQNLRLQTLKKILFSQQFKMVLIKFKKYQKDRFYNLAIKQLKESCQTQLNRLSIIKKSETQLRKVQIDSQTAIIVILNSIKCLVDLKNFYLNSKWPETFIKQEGNHSSIQMTVISYENLRLNVEKSDQRINQFLQNHLYHVNTQDINANQIKKFFQRINKQIFQTSSDKIMLSLARLCKVIVVLCKILDGNVQVDQIVQIQQHFKGNQRKNIVVNKVKTKSFRFNETAENQEVYSQKQNCKSRKSLQNNNNNWTEYSSPDIGLKVNELSKICEQIPQLETFLRTLKFSKISLQHRQYFFKIVQILIALHHKVSYLSRNKPALLRQIQYMSMELSSIHESIISFLCQIQNQAQEFKSIHFNKQIQDDSSHQMTQLYSSFRRDLMKMSEIIINQDKNQSEMYNQIQRIKEIIYSFYNMSSGNQTEKWEQFFNKGTQKDFCEEEIQIINILNQCYVNFENELRSRPNIVSDQQTQKNLQQQVNILLADYERLKTQHHELNGRFNIILQNRDQLIGDLEQRDRIIRSLNAVITQKRRQQEKLKQQLDLADNDHEQFKKIIASLQEQLSHVAKQNQRQRQHLIYGHQDQIKELIDKINQLQKSKTDLMKKYEEQCRRNIRNLSGSSSISNQLQYQKQKLQEKIKEFEDNQKNYKQKIFSLQKLLQEFKNDKNLLQSQLQVAQKNKKRLMEKLQESQIRINQSFRDTQQKLQDQINVNRQNIYKLQKELQKYKRNNQLLQNSNQNLQNQLNQQYKLNNQLRSKMNPLLVIQNEYQSLGRQYNQLVDKYQKLQKYNYQLKNQNQQLLKRKQDNQQLLQKKQQQQKKFLKKIKDLQEKIQQLNASIQSNLQEIKNAQKQKKKNENKVFDLELQLKEIQQQANQKQRTLNSSLQKSQQNRRQMQQKHMQTISKYQNQLAQNQKLIKKLNQQISILTKRQKQNQFQYQKKLSEYQQNVNFYKNKLLEEQNRSKELQQESYNISILLNQTKREKDLIEKRQVERKNLQQQKRQLQIKMDQMQQTERNLKNQIDRLSTEVDRLKRELEELINKLKLRQKQLHQYQTKLNLNQKSLQSRISQQISIVISQKEQQLKNSKLKQYEVSKQNKQLQQQIEKLRRINQKLQENINRIAQQKQKVNAALQEKNQKDLIERQLNDKLNESDKAINQYKLTILNIKNQHKELQNNCRNLENSNKQLNKNQQEMKLKLLENEGVLSQNVREISKLKLSLKQLKEENDQSTNIIKKLKDSLKQKEKQIQRLLQRQNELKRESSQKDIQLVQQKQTIQNLKKDCEKKIQRAIKQKQQNQNYYESLLKNKSQNHKNQIAAQGNTIRKLIQIQYQEKILLQKQSLIIKLGDQRLQQLDENRKKYERKINEQIEARNNIQEKYRLLAQELASLKENGKTYNSPIKDNSQQINELNRQLQEMKVQLSRSQGQKIRLQKENIKLNEQLSKNIQTQHALNIIQTKYNQVNISWKQAHSHISNLETQKSSLKQDIQKLRLKNKDLEDQLKNYSIKEEDFNEKINSLQAKLKQWKNKQLIWKQKENEWQEKLREEKVSDLREKAYKQTIKNLQQKLSNLSRQLDLRNQNWSNERAQLQNKIFEYKKMELQISNLRSQILVNSDASCQNKILSSNYFDLQNKFKQLQIQNEQLMRAKKNLQSQRQKLIKQNIERQKEVNRINFKQDEILNLKQNLNKIQQELKNTLKNEDQRLIGYKKQKEQLIQKLNRLQLENQKLTFQNKQLHSNIEKLKALIKQLEIKLSQFQPHQTSHLEQELSKLKAFYEQQMQIMRNNLISQFDLNQKNIISQCQTVLSGLTQELNAQKNKNKNLEDKIAITLNQNNKKKQIIQQLNRMKYQMEQQIKNITKEKQSQSQLTKELNKLLFQKQQLQRQIQINKNTIQFLNTQLNGQIHIKNQLQLKLNSMEIQLKSQRQKIYQLTNQKTKTQQNQNQQIFKLKTQLALTRQQLLRLNGIIQEREVKIQNQIRTLVNQKNEYIALFNKATQEINNLKNSMMRQKQEIDGLRNQILRKDNEIAGLIQNNLKMKIKQQDLLKKNQQLDYNMKKVFLEIQNQRKQFNSINSHQQQMKLSQSRLKQQNQHLFGDNKLLALQLNALKQQFNKASSDCLKLKIQSQSKSNQLNQISIHIINLRNQIQMIHKQKQILIEQNKNLFNQLQNYKCEKCKYKDQQIFQLRERVREVTDSLQIMNKQIQNMQKQIKKLNQQINETNTSLTDSVHSKSMINLNTKSYVYQGGQVTAQQFMKMQQDLKRLQRQAKQKDQLIFKYRSEISQYIRQIEVLKQKIKILAQGKTINIKGYTRITNTKDMSLNLIGRTYSQYDVRQMKAKIQDLQNKIKKYRNRQTQLLSQIQKFKFREKGYLDQIKKISGNQTKQSLTHQNMRSPKKTAFDKEVDLPLSSTYRMQSQVQDNSYFIKLEGEKLRETIQRISSSNHIMSSKIDQLLSNSRRSNRQQLNQSQIQLLPQHISNQIRQLIYQNKALIETLREMKQNRQDISNLINQYINPDDLTEFVYRVLIYFSEVNEEESSSIKAQLLNIRANNSGGFYFTMLQEYTKYILQNNATQLYKKDLRQKSLQLERLKKVLEEFLNNKINDSTNLLQRSDSKKSIIYKNMSKSRHLSGSRVQQEQNSKQRRPITQFIGSLQVPTISITGTQRKASSTISYVPYNQQIWNNNVQQTTSNSRVNITYASNMNQSFTDRK